MPNVDEHGNKIAAKVEKKSIISRRIREKRTTLLKSSSLDFQDESAFCNVCGYRKRSKNHKDGTHHKSAN